MSLNNWATAPMMMPRSWSRLRRSNWDSSGAEKLPVLAATCWARSSANCLFFSRQVLGSSEKYLSASNPRRSSCSSCSLSWAKLLLRLLIPNLRKCVSRIRKDRGLAKNTFYLVKSFCGTKTSMLNSGGPTSDLYISHVALLM